MTARSVSRRNDPRGAQSQSLEAFVEACDRALTKEAVRALLLEAALRAGFDRILLASHGGSEHLGAFCVRVHNLGQAAHDGLFAGESVHPLFDAIASARSVLRWSEASAWKGLSLHHRAAIEAVFRASGAEGIWLSKRLATGFAPASCSLRASGQIAPHAALMVMRAASHAFFAIAELQRSVGVRADKLTVREHECMQLAVLEGLRPREVARALGVSINTVRTLRKSACARLGARSPEEAVWRMVTTEQLFTGGRRGRRRIWTAE